MKPRGNAMSENNDFALAPRPSGALEKAEPGAKRILSGMVADTLALMPARINAVAEGWFEKAGNQLQTAREHSKSYSRYSESVQASQEIGRAHV